MDANIRRKAKGSDQITNEYFDELYIELRHIDSVLADTSYELYGKKFKTPVTMAALSHLKGKGGEGDGMVQMAEGARLSGTVNWVGMATTEQFTEIMKTGAETIWIMKPYADESLVTERIKLAEKLGALAIGMDLDHAFAPNGDYFNVLGYPIRPRTLKEIEGYCKSTDLPFIVKGVTSAVDAKKCLEAGVKGIVISHHHGIFPSVVPPLMVLPEIAKVIDGRIPIFIDCGFSNGCDVFKGLALGADAVCIGRAVMPGISSNGAEGAAKIIDDITAELKGFMANTGCAKLSDINSSYIWKSDGTHLSK